MIEQLKALEENFVNEIGSLKNRSDILNLKAQYLGKKGSLSEILKSLKSLSDEERKEVGPKTNQVKEKLNTMISEKLQSLEIEEMNEKLKKDWIDLGLRESHFLCLWWFCIRRINST